VPGLIAMFGVLYLTLHLGLTSAYLLWLYHRDPVAFPVIRTTLLAATALSVVVFVLYPTAPPRMAGMGIVDTVTSNHVDLNHGLIRAFYNPFAAIPSLHFGWALVIGLSLYRHSQSLTGKIGGGAYPIIVLTIIIATGNHFVLDALAGAAVVGAGYLLPVTARNVTARRVAAKPTAQRRNSASTRATGSLTGSAPNSWPWTTAFAARRCPSTCPSNAGDGQLRAGSRGRCTPRDLRR
jgi:PAP2 superfamily